MEKEIIIAKWKAESERRDRELDTKIRAMFLETAQLLMKRDMRSEARKYVAYSRRLSEKVDNAN